MLIFVIICNLLLTLLNLYIVGCLWRWRQRFHIAYVTFEQLDSQIQQVLSPTPEILLDKKDKIATLKELYQQWSIYLQRFQQILFLLSFTVNLWRRPRRGIG